MRAGKKCNSIQIRVILTLAGVLSCQTQDIDIKKYKQMPPLYLADDYEQCLSSGSHSYCMVYAEIQPQADSALWHYIDEFYKNSSATRYRHDQLYRAICTSRCQNYVNSSLPHWNVQEIQPTSDNLEMAHKQYALSRSQTAIAAYEQRLHQCVNDDMRRQYNLSVKTFVRYCNNPQEPIEKDSRYSIAVVVFTVIVAINLLSTLYDVQLRTQQKGLKLNEYYDTKHTITVHHYLTTFSVYRNFRRLVKRNDSTIGKDFAFVDGFRTLLSIVIVFEHVPVIHFLPQKTHERLEQENASTFTLWLLHIMSSIELFFLLSSLMLYIKFAKNKLISPKTRWRKCVRVFVRMMISRYLRYMPSLLLVIQFSTSVLFYIGDGPFWRHSIEPTVLQCQTEWWANIFMRSNRHPNKTCWFPTWYITADFQLYGIFLAFLIITTKCPQYKKLVYTAIGLWGISVPSIINYVQKLNSITTFTAETYRHLYFKDIETALNVYYKAYTNFNGFFVGIICGELYMKYLQHDKYKYIWGRYLRYTPPIGWSIIFSIWYLGTKIIFQENTIWISMFAILHRHVSVAIVAMVVILRGLCTGGGFLTQPIFRLLARISYQVYLWHIVVITAAYASYRSLPETSNAYMFYMTAYFYILTALIATVVATMVEYPIAELLSVFDLKGKSKMQKVSKE